MLKHYDYLIVGAGLYGATIARKLLNSGFSCLIIDKNDYIGGMCYTRKFNGIDIHEFGPHIFHTSNEDVWNFVNKYSKFNLFELKVYAGKEMYSLPFNMNTYKLILGITSPEEAFHLPISCYNNNNFKEYAVSVLGEELFEKIVRPYTEKLWNTVCENLPSDILKRLPLRYTYDNNYFNDKYLGIPSDGYTKLIENIINGFGFEAPIEVHLNREFSVEEDYNLADKIIYCGAVDELLNFLLGKLNWRGVQFKHVQYEYNGHNHQGCPIWNNLGDEPYTRTIDHILFNKELSATYKGCTLRTYEFPSNSNKCYPICNEENITLYNKYILLLSSKYPKITLGGRLGLYLYLDMDDTIKLALEYKDSKQLKSYEHFNEDSNFCKIWIVGTVDSDILEINLDWYNKFITRKEYSKLNINSLNRFLSEYVAMYYVWKNNIYSNFVGFCHYRRLIEPKDINFNYIYKDNTIQYFYHLHVPLLEEYEHWYKKGPYNFISRKLYNVPEIVVNDCMDYLLQLTIIPQDKLLLYCNTLDKEGKYYYYNREIYCCKWEVFNDLMLFLNGYIEYISNKYNLKSYNDWVNHISKDIISDYKKRIPEEKLKEYAQYSIPIMYLKHSDFAKIYKDDEGLNSFCNCWRAYSYMIEDLISIYIGTHQ